MAQVSTTTITQLITTGGPANDQAFQGWYLDSSSTCGYMLSNRSMVADRCIFAGVRDRLPVDPDLQHTQQLRPILRFWRYRMLDIVVVLQRQHTDWDTCNLELVVRLSIEAATMLHH